MDTTGSSHGVSNDTYSQTVRATSEPKYPHTLWHRDYAVLAAVEQDDVICYAVANPTS